MFDLTLPPAPKIARVIPRPSALWAVPQTVKIPRIASVAKIGRVYPSALGGDGTITDS